MRAADVSSGQVVQTVRSGDLQIALLSPTGTLHQGRNTFTIEFRSANGELRRRRCACARAQT